VLGQALGCTTLSLMQGAIFLAMAPLAGIHLSFAAIVVSLAMMGLIAFAMTSIGLAMAWRTESTQGFHAFMNMLLLPIWMLSGAVFPVAGAPAWFQWTTRLNPLTTRWMRFGGDCIWPSRPRAARRCRWDRRWRLRSRLPRSPLSWRRASRATPQRFKRRFSAGASAMRRRGESSLR